MVRAILFDAYGTLFDVHSVTAACEAVAPQRGAELSQRWRTKQLEYSWLRGLGGRYVSFWSVTQQALDVACDAMQISLSTSSRQTLLDAYFSLRPYSEVMDVLGTLRSRGVNLGTLSNGSPEMLQAVLQTSGVHQLLDHVLSVDAVKQFKPHPSVYALGTQALRLPANDILFVSSNAWDIAGASWFGYRTFWINRAGAPRERLDGVASEGEAKTLTALLPLFAASR